MTRSRLGVWPPLAPRVWATRARKRALPFPLDHADCRLFSRARHGLWAGLHALGVERGDEVLVPAYNHGSEIEALVQAGLTCRFYAGDETLAPDEAELESLRTPRVRALYLIHYLGFPQDVSRWRGWADERGLLLIEDAAQAWLATSGGAPVGTLGDLSLFCLYKTFGLPDGAAIVSRVPPDPPERRPPLRAGVVARRHAAWLMERSGMLAAAGTALQGDRPYDPSADFALGDPGTPPSVPTRFLLPRIVDHRAAARRRANYSALLEELGDLVRAPFGVLPEGASPFAFLFEHEDRDGAVQHFRERGIGAYPFWLAFHPATPAEDFPEIAVRRGRTVALPVHQELTRAAVGRIVAAAHSIPRG
jgi:dTDP-4-amino-4,6-dideoxygalactose transaminase